MKTKITISTKEELREELEIYFLSLNERLKREEEDRIKKQRSAVTIIRDPSTPNEPFNGIRI